MWRRRAAHAIVSDASIALLPPATIASCNSCSPQGQRISANKKSNSLIIIIFHIAPPAIPTPSKWFAMEDRLWHQRKRFVRNRFTSSGWLLVGLHMHVEGGNNKADGKGESYFNNPNSAGQASKALGYRPFRSARADGLLDRSKRASACNL